MTDDEPNWNVNWEETGEVDLHWFECPCGWRSDRRYVTHHGCGRPELEVIECENCHRVWRARWVGMTFVEE